MFEPFAAPRPGRVWQVGELVAAVGSVVEGEFAACTVRGEVSNFARAASGHCYFNVKDADGTAMLRCAMFRRAAQLASFQPRDGDAVDLRGRLSIYEPRGELQFVVEAIQRSGAGALYERFLRLKARLEAEGLFEAGRKRPLPRHPTSIGVVTSLAGAALHDVATTLARRSPHLRVVLYPSLVQGDEAPAALCAALALAGARNEVDVLIVCRGGGSIEDLWAFNDEAVVRTVAALTMPVVSGIGHETDLSLVDLAADLRAATPTAAAEVVAPATAAAQGVLDAHEAALGRRIAATLDREAQRLDRLAGRLARPGEQVRRRGHRLDLLAERLRADLRRSLERRRLDRQARADRFARLVGAALADRQHRLDRLATRLAALDPRRLLSRGYALLTDGAGRPIVGVASLSPGDRVQAALVDGSAGLVVETVSPAAIAP